MSFRTPVALMIIALIVSLALLVQQEYAQAQSPRGPIDCPSIGSVNPIHADAYGKNTRNEEWDTSCYYYASQLDSSKPPDANARIGVWWIPSDTPPDKVRHEYCKTIQFNSGTVLFAENKQAYVTVAHNRKDPEGYVNQLVSAGETILNQVSGLAYPCEPAPPEPVPVCHTPVPLPERDYNHATDVEWVLSETVINPSGTELSRTDGRLLSRPGGGEFGTIHKYDMTVSETTITEHVVTLSDIVRGAGDDDDPGYESRNWKYTFNFDRPPEVLVPGQVVSLASSATAEGFPESRKEKKAFHYDTTFSIDLDDNEMFVNSLATSCSMESRFVVPGRRGFRTTMEISAIGPCLGCKVTWIYELKELPEADQPSEAPEAIDDTEDTEIPPEDASLAPDDEAGDFVEETPKEKLERAIAQNIVDYVHVRKQLDSDLSSFYGEAEFILTRLRDAQWMLKNGLDEDKVAAQAEIDALKQDMAALMDRFDSRVATLEEALEGMESLFVDYEQRQEYLETVRGYKSEIKLLRINLALRSGNVDEFDRLFPQYREDDNIAAQVFVGNAFRQLMEGDTRTALASVNLALDRDENNPTARQLLQDLELDYLARIRDRLAGEKSQIARLFNDKLNGHGEEGIFNVLLDVATTGAGESLQALAGYSEIHREKGMLGLIEAGYRTAEGNPPKGYYDFLQEIASLEIDEATVQIAGIKLVEELRSRGVTFDDMNNMTVPQMQEVILQKFGRSLDEDQAMKLRQRMWDSFRNVDVDAIRKGEKTQFNVDVGKDYFDTQILQQDEGDLVARQFSAWDTFLTFAPSAQLGKVSQTGVAARLGLTAESTLQQGLQKGLRLHELGKRIYQTKTGAAIVDATFELNAFEKMVSDSIKNRVGEAVYEAGSTAVSTAISQMSAPAKKALQEELQKISDHYLGTGTTENVKATIATLNQFFGFIGLNAKTLQQGAYGVDKRASLESKIKGQVNRDNAIVNNVGVATATSRPRSFRDFESQVNQGGDAFVGELESARSRLKGVGQGPGVARRQIVDSADDTLEQMQEAARAIRAGDSARAQQIWNQMQNGIGQTLDDGVSERARRIGSFNDQLRQIEVLKPVSPQDKDIVKAVLGQLSKGDKYEAGRSEFLAALSAAGLSKVKLE